MQLCDGRLVKTRKFKAPSYVGDPLNAVRIFNEKRVDELIIIDITPNRFSRSPNINLLRHIFSECEMPVTYGGGVCGFDMASKIFHLGCEKIIFNTAFYNDLECIEKVVANFGSQAVSISLDYRYSFLRKEKFYKNSGQKVVQLSLVEIIDRINRVNAGELVLNSIDNDGSFKGYDYSLLKKIKQEVNIPIVLLGGCNQSSTSREAVDHGAHSVAASSRFIYHGPHNAILIKYERF
ncbi:MAG: imidazole glycerol phosphate synthase subunit HisF [Alphaproteobacteria bacterium]|nr:MAG: imidazole glycerol phosphate synthase subunit HisF [Alphaproteobacteria bacterium]